MQFSEIFAWNEPELAAPLLTGISTGMSVSTGNLERIFGLTLSSLNHCVDFSRTVAGFPTFEFDLP